MWGCGCGGVYDFFVSYINIMNNTVFINLGGLPPWLPAFSTAALGGLLFGSDIGASSSVVRSLGTGLSDLGSLDALALGQVASASLLGATAASASLIILGDEKIGRKTELITASSFFLLGTLIQSQSPSLELIILGRVIYGLGIGTAMHVAPLYIAETSPDNLRGRLVSLKEAAIVAGIVLGYFAGSIFAGNELAGWRNVYISVFPLEILMLLGGLYVPESARWLSLRGRVDEAAQAFQDVQGISEAEARNKVNEMAKMTLLDSSSAAASVTKDGFIEKLKEISGSKYNRQALLIGVGLVLFQQLSGFLCDFFF